MSPKTTRKRNQLTQLMTEAEYFHRLDVELLDQMRKRAAFEDERLRLSEVSEVQDQAILDALAHVGFNHGNAMLLHLLPLIQVAWIDGWVSGAERDRIVTVARSRGIEEGGAADRQLSLWLDQQPSEEVYRTAVRALRATLETLPPAQNEARANSLLRSCTDVAAASGGLFGLTVSPAEQELLEDLARQFESDHPIAARQVVSDIQCHAPRYGPEEL
jgi:hypothetical protein